MLDISTPDGAYVLGLLQTDGTHEGSVDGKGRVSIELAARDEEVLHRIARVLPCYSSVGLRTRTTNFGADYGTATLRFYDQDMRRSIAANGVPAGRKSRTIGPPNGDYCSPDYVRGLLDGDGSLGFTKKGEPFVGFVTASSAMAEFFASTIKDVCGVTRTARPNTRDGVFNIMVLNCEATALVTWAWYSPTVLGLARKASSAKQVKAWAPDAGRAGRYGFARAQWTDVEDQIVLTRPQSEAVRLLGRTVSSVSVRKWRLRHPVTI